MRRIFMGALIGLGLITVQQNAKAIVRLTAPPDDPAKEFWIESRSLVQEQLRLLDRMEQSLTQQPDSKRLQVLKGQIFLHLTELDRYLQSNHPDPVEFCNVPHSPEGEIAGTDAISPQEATVYCSLFQSGQEMAGVRSYLDRQLKLGTKPTFQPTSIGTKKIPATPAQMYLNSTLAMVQSARERILQARPLFPTAFQPTIPESQTAIASTQYPEFLATEWKPHADFLAQPNTGIARLSSAELFLAADTSRTQSQSQLAFPVIANRPNGFSPRLPIRISGNLFQVIPSGLDYGFVADMGDVPLEKLQVPQGENLRSLPKLLQFFYTYRPPTQLEAIQSDRKRFTSGNVVDFGLNQPLSNFISAQLNRTYLVRSVQYKIPELMTAGRTISQDERQLLERLSQAQSSDVLVAIRPVNLRPDGTYTILWKLMKQFPDPQIRDLTKTVKRVKSVASNPKKV